MAKLHDQDIDLGLDRFKVLLAKLGNPQDQMPATIHVAGTNAKGSTIAMLQACFDAASYRVGCFISPHLVRPHECINYNGMDITEEELEALLKEILKANDDAPLTVFEAICAAMFLYFSRSKAHIVLLETGMGGAGDATNVIQTPVLTVLTPISYDHQEFLGKKLSQIASHKAGIMKQHVSCVIAKQEDEAYDAIRERAKELDNKLFREGREWFIKRAGTRMIFEGWNGDHAWPLPSLEGDHQVANAGIALACLEALKPAYNLPEEAIRNGLKTVYWPGRLQKILLEKHLPKRFEAWVDGGHNEHAAKALRSQMKAWDDQPLYMVCGMLKSKDSKAYLSQIAEFATHIYTVPISDQKFRKPEKLAKDVDKLGGKATACNDLQDALQMIKANHKKAGRVLICGSLYLVGDVLRLLEGS